MVYTVHQAKTNLSRLLQEACAGKDVVIARDKKPVARLVPVGGARKRRVPGRLAGQISHTSNAFAPLTPRELRKLGFK